MDKDIIELKRMSQPQLIEYTQQLQQLLQERKDPMDSTTTAYVTADGTYGEGDLLVFHPDALTGDQWNIMMNMRDNDRMDYVKAILEGDLDTVVAMEFDYIEPDPVDGYYGDHRKSQPEYPDTPKISDHS